jgi:putative Ca2+/H+ antiporter (TMEM165/GDT1 family)
MTVKEDPHKNILSVENYWQGFFAGFAIIAISGFGDKIFFLNMIFVSINSFCYAFWVALAISEIMNLINISLGELLKQYISIPILEYIAIGVFTFFGIWLIIKGIKMPERRLIQDYEEERKLLLNNEEKLDINENEKENEINNLDKNNAREVEVMEAGEGEKNRNLQEIGVFDSWWKYLITYFLASVGDRSQIASILITSKYSFIPIFNGTSIGVLSLVLISMVLGKTISRLLTNKQISIICGILFLFYAIVYFIDRKITRRFKY